MWAQHCSTWVLNEALRGVLGQAMKESHLQIYLLDLNLLDLVASWESLDFFSKCLFMYQCIIAFYHNMCTSIIIWKVPCSISYTLGTYDNWVVCHIRLPNFLTISAHHTSFSEVAIGRIIGWLSKNILYNICYRIAGAILRAECSKLCRVLFYHLFGL